MGAWSADSSDELPVELSRASLGPRADDVELVDEFGFPPPMEPCARGL